MAMKHIIVQVNDSERGAKRTDIAIALTQREDAHLVGLGIDTLGIYPSFFEAELPPRTVETQAERLREHAAAAEAMFLERTKQAGVSAEWRLVHKSSGDLGRQLTDHARYADLTIIGQPNPQGDEQTLRLNLEERLIMNAGGSVLVVPFFGTFDAVGERILIAWDGGREAKRAVNDALDFLTGASAVVVLQVNPKGDTHAERDIEVAEMAAHLTRHGIKAEGQQIVAEDMKVGDMILSRAADAKADMIVMGAYGQSRLLEFVLGGATRYVLKHMTMPVLMSH